MANCSSSRILVWSLRHGPGRIIETGVDPGLYTSGIARRLGSRVTGLCRDSAAGRGHPGGSRGIIGLAAPPAHGCSGGPGTNSANLTKRDRGSTRRRKPRPRGSQSTARPGATGAFESRGLGPRGDAVADRPSAVVYRGGGPGRCDRVAGRWGSVTGTIAMLVVRLKNLVVLRWEEPRVIGLGAAPRGREGVGPRGRRGLPDCGSRARRGPGPAWPWCGEAAGERAGGRPRAALGAVSTGAQPPCCSSACRPHGETFALAPRMTAV